MPKREKARILAAMQQSSNTRSHEKAVAAELEDEERLLLTVVQAHLETCDFTKAKVQPMLVQAREHPSYTDCPATLVSKHIIHSFIPFHQYWRLNLNLLDLYSKERTCLALKLLLR